MAVKREPWEYTVSVPVRNYGSPGFYLAGLFDMLRYDGATVESWDSENSDRGVNYTLRLKSTSFTPDRWRSFGLYPKEVYNR